MRLNLSVRSGNAHRDLSLDLDPALSSEAAYDLISEKLGLRPGTFSLRLERLAEVLQPTDPIAAYALRNGDVLLVEDGSPSGISFRGVDLALRVVTGPARGFAIPVPAAGLDLGRTIAKSNIQLLDETISSEHARIDFQGGSPAIRDLGSTNGSWVNGVEITAPTPISPGDHIALGETTLEVFIPPSVEPPSHITYSAGSLQINRPPRIRPQDPSSRFAIDPPPDTAPKRKIPVLTSLIPVITGLALYYAAGRNVIYLFFIAGGPLMVVSSWYSDRRSGRTEFTAKAKSFAETVARIDAEATRRRADAESWRKDRDPEPTSVRAALRLLDERIWQRRPHDDDFLSVRLGTADQPSLVSIQLGSGGDTALRSEAEAVIGKHALDRGVPVIVSLTDTDILGLHGTPAETAATARWLGVQVAAHHSPKEAVIVVIAPGDAAAWEWMKWLPHVDTLGVVEPAIALDDDHAKDTLSALQRLVDERTRARERFVPGSRERITPHVVAFVRPPLRVSATQVSGLLDRLHDLGITLVWLAADRGALPNQCSVIVDVGRTPEVRNLGANQAVALSMVDAMDLETATACARMVTPLVDATRADATTTLSRTVDLVDLLGEDMLEPATIVQSWGVTTKGLPAVVGRSTEGEFVLDLERDGPHGLVAGTTGSGKSELLQTLVGSLAATFGPDRVNFVLIDYKGGAAFRDCIDLPHVVGFVTDLDEHLAERAIESLNAELRYRERLLKEGGFKDLAAMRRAGEAPPSLIIVVDEFAALKTEVPDFVDGVIDIAQRGRSLGIHLVLATQKPRGVIDRRIQANTNLRIALRVTDTDESQDVIGVPDAARLSRHLPGRAFVKTGESEITEIQTAYVGGGAVAETRLADPAKTFRFPKPSAGRDRSEPIDQGPSHLAQLVLACREAAERLDLPEPRRPWLPPLPGQVALDALDLDAAVAPDVAIGLLDDTARQQQSTFVLDLGSLGNAVILGASGSGKTTALRTIAAALASTYPVSEVHVYGLDFAGRALAALTRLPNCGDVVYGDELDRVRRFIAMLEETLVSRRRQLAAVGAASVLEYDSASGEPMPVIVTLVDGFGALWESLEDLDRGELFDSVLRLITEGRSAGLSFVITADRRGSLPAALYGVVPRHLALRLANADEYAAVGFKAPAGFTRMAPGRAMTESGEVQIAVLGAGSDVGGAVQAAAMATIVSPPGDDELRPSAVKTLAEVVTIDQVPSPKRGAMQIPVGLSEHGLRPAMVDFAQCASFLVAGPPGSGRSTALRTITTGLRDAHPKAEFVLVTGRRSPLLDDPWTRMGQGLEQAGEVIQGIGESTTAAKAGVVKTVLVVDDADEMTEGPVAAALETVLTRSRDTGVVVLISMTTFRVLRGYSGWLVGVRHQRSGLLLQPDLDTDGDAFHLSLPKRSGLTMPVGRGYLISGNAVTMVQVATG